MELDGHTLTAADVVTVARSQDGLEVRPADEARARLVKTRQYIEANWLRPDAPPIYGFKPAWVN
jgi:hypothetical protein